MGLAQDVIDHFDANWGAGGGVEPSWYLRDLKIKHSKVLSCLVEELPLGQPKSKAIGADRRYKTRQGFILDFYCADRTDAEKKATEAKRLIGTKTVTSGFWTWEGEDYDEYIKLTNVYVAGTQIKWR